MPKLENNAYIVTDKDIRENVRLLAQKLGSKLSDFEYNFGMFTTELSALNHNLAENNPFTKEPFSKDTLKALHKLERDLSKRDEYIDDTKISKSDKISLPIAQFVSPTLVQDMRQNSFDDNAVYTDKYFKVIYDDTIDFITTYLAVDAKRDVIDTETQDFLNEE